VSPGGSGDSRLGAAVLVGWTTWAGGWGSIGAAPSLDGDGLDSLAWVTDWTVLIQTAGLGLRARAVAPSINTAAAPATASASFLPVTGR
jgi:hypothetical protein